MKYFGQPDNPGAFLYDAILDGKLVHDQYPTESSPRLTLYISQTVVMLLPTAESFHEQPCVSHGTNIDSIVELG
jgi:hypothetical protein